MHAFVVNERDLDTLDEVNISIYLSFEHWQFRKHFFLYLGLPFQDQVWFKLDTFFIKLKLLFLQKMESLNVFKCLR